MKKKSGLLYEFLDFIKTLLISFLIVYLITTFAFRPIKVQGNSMYPNLVDGEYGISNVMAKKLEGINRFDIVIVYLKDSNEYLVKRVIGLPGETISYKDNKLYVNGEVMEEPFLNNQHVISYTLGNFTSDFDEYLVPYDEYFLLGDNRPFSKDSRFYGSFNIEQIVCKDVYVIYPFEQFGKVLQ